MSRLPLLVLIIALAAALPAADEPQPPPERQVQTVVFKPADPEAEWELALHEALDKLERRIPAEADPPWLAAVEDLCDVADLIRSTCDVAAWDWPGRYIEIRGCFLFVSTVPDTHREVMRILELLPKREPKLDRL